jgi:tetratricopeptide (TPR) repeat protein
MELSARQLLLVAATAVVTYLSVQGVPASIHGLAARAWSLAGDEARRERHLVLMVQALRPSDREIRLAGALQRLANVHRRQGRYTEAGRELREALTIQERLYGTDQAELIPLLRELSWVFREQLRPYDAESTARRAVAIGDALQVEDRERARSLELLALSHVDQNRLEEAEAELRRSLALREAELGPAHPEVALSLARLGSLLRQRGRLAPAELYLERAYAVMTEGEFAGRSPQLGLVSVLNDLGLVYRDQGRLGEARKALETALSMLEEPAAKEGQAAVLASLGSVLLAGGHRDAATQRDRQALELSDTSPSTAPLAAALHNNLGAASGSQGHYGEAREHFERALELLAGVLPEEHPLMRSAAANAAHTQAMARNAN